MMKKTLYVLGCTLWINGCVSETPPIKSPTPPSLATSQQPVISIQKTVTVKSALPQQIMLPANQINCDDIKNKQYQQAILKAINDIRSRPQQCGVNYYPATSSLKWHGLLEQSSSTYAVLSAQRRVLSHYGSEGQSLRDRIKLTGYKGGGGENLASGQQTLEEVLGHWLSLSPGHCDNLMQTKYRHYAIACQRSEINQRPYWVQQFGSGKDDTAH